MKFYSYLWLREDGTPYYAGKGTGDRAYTRYNHRIGPPKDKSRILIFPQESEAEAFESEIALIELFGRKDIGTGCLRNLTPGGENPPPWRRRGYKRGPEYSAKLSARMMGNTYGLGKKMSEEHRKRLGDISRGHKASAETRQKMSLAKKGKPSNQPKGFKHSEETKKFLSALNTKRFIKTVAWG